MQSEYLPLPLSVMAIVIGFILMYGVWYTDRRLMRGYEHPEMRGQLWAIFLRHPALVGISLVLPPFAGVVLVASGTVGVQEWLSPGHHSDGLLLSGFLAMAVFVSFVVYDMRHCCHLSRPEAGQGVNRTAEERSGIGVSP